MRKSLVNSSLSDATSKEMNYEIVFTSNNNENNKAQKKEEKKIESIIE